MANQETKTPEQNNSKYIPVVKLPTDLPMFYQEFNDYGYLFYAVQGSFKYWVEPYECN